MPARLTDMEELLERVAAPDIVGYLREALTCYSAGAHRACIVMTFIAVFEDLRGKTKALANVNATARTISQAIDGLANGQKPFESQLINQLETNNLITPLQAQRLKQIIDHRNKAAHPTGLIASAEEARFVFFEAVDKYLSQPVLSTTLAVDRIIAQLGGGNFFPSNSIENITGVVASEVASTHPSAHAYLAIKLIDLLSTGDSTTAQNARNFILGLSTLDGIDARLALSNHLIKNKCSDTNFGEIIFMAITANAKLISEANTLTRSRLNSLLISVVDTTEQTIAINSMRHPIRLMDACLRTTSDFASLVDIHPLIEAIIRKYWNNPEMASVALKNTATKGGLLDLYLELASSLSYDTANRFAKTLPDLDVVIAEEYQARDICRLVAAVCRAADNGAWSSRSLRSAKFASVPNIRSKALAALTADANLYSEVADEFSLSETLEGFRETYLIPNTSDDVAF